MRQIGLKIGCAAALFVGARAAAVLEVSVPQISGQYSDEVSLTASVQKDGSAAAGVLVSFSLWRDDEQVLQAGSGRTDATGAASVNIALDNGMYGTVHELKEDRTDDDVFRSFSVGVYTLKALATDLEHGESGAGEGVFVLRAEQAAAEIEPLRRVAGYEAVMAIRLIDDDDDHDKNYIDGEVSEVAQRGVQGRRVTFYFDYNADGTFYACQAGGMCRDGHCAQCAVDTDCGEDTTCSDGACVAAGNDNLCTADADCGAMGTVQEIHCVGGVCVGEVCDRLGSSTTDELGRAGVAFGTLPNEFGQPTVGTLTNRMRVEFAGDPYFSAVASTGTLTLFPDALDIGNVAIRLSMNGEVVQEVGAGEIVSVDVHAFLRDALGNIYGANDTPYIVVDGECSSCPAESTCDPIVHNRCIRTLDPEDVEFEASSGVFISRIERNLVDGTFHRIYRPGDEPGEVQFKVRIGDLVGGDARLRLFDTGCGCTGGAPLGLLPLFVVWGALRRRRRTG
jgi:uncharacterized protein (TIGR03382 family)